ncbi:ImuA family protein [Taibaiella koreensis]|uniref:ImuA family protein n=1 Tax=Taibaiella koreensis TaxID=1268548 RepID=UPI000E59B35F|nr:Error-prone repair protein ImuA [Taibaiella koreensis]
MNQCATNREQIQALQQEILSMQGFHATAETAQIDTGLGPIQQAFPNHTFPTGAIHEFLSLGPGQAAATAGFIAGLLGALMQKGPCLWISPCPIIFPVALKTFGLTPDQVIFTTVSRTKDMLWTVEEALKCEALAAVVGEVRDLGFTPSRRLQLAVEQSRVTGFIHRPGCVQPGSTACVSRWQVRPLPGLSEDGLPGVGFPQWQVTLSKVRNGKPGAWQVGWTDTGFKVAAMSLQSREPMFTQAAG